MLENYEKIELMRIAAASSHPSDAVELYHKMVNAIDPPPVCCGPNIEPFEVEIELAPGFADGLARQVQREVLRRPPEDGSED